MCGSACGSFVSLDGEFLVGVEFFCYFMVGEAKICDNFVRSLGV